MQFLRRRSWQVCAFAAWLLILVTTSRFALAQERPASTPGAQVAKTVGTIRTVQAGSIVIAVESGGDATANLVSSTKILRVPAGEKDLKNAVALQVQDLQPGDRVLVRGQAVGDGQVITALAVIVMKQSDVAAKQQHDRDDWQKRGVGGLVTKVDTTAGTISISSNGISANRTITVHIAKDTVLRRYAPGSVKFDDAKPAPIDQIKAGDQLRARGTRTPDGNEIAAEEIVTGSFRNIAGTVKSVNAASNSITVQDAISKSAVTVRISSDSQVKKLPAEMAQRIAARLKGAAGANREQGGAGQGTRSGGQSAGTSGSEERPVGGQPDRGPGGGGANGNGPPDLQRMLSRLPNSTLADLQKGDAVMIVCSDTGSSDAITAITLLAGVDAILTAPNHAASLLSPWSLNTSGGEGESAQ